MWLRVSLMVAAIAATAIAAYAWHDRNIAEKIARQHLRELKRRHALPAEFREVDIETVNLTQYDLEVPASVVFRQSVANFLVARWFLWVPAVAVLCVGIGGLVHLAVRSFAARSAV